MKDPTSVWASSSLAKRNFILIIAFYFVSMMLSDFWFSAHSAITLLPNIVILLSIGVTAISMIFKSEEDAQSVLNFLVSLISVLGCFYFLLHALMTYFDSDLFWTKGTIDFMIRDRLLQGQIPPGVKMTLTLPLQSIPMGMDITLAKRVTIANLIIVGTTLLFILSMNSSNEEVRFCAADAQNRQMTFVQDFLLLLYAVGVAYFSLASGLQLAEEYNKSLRAGRLADSVLNHILKNNIAGAACLIEMDIKDSMQANKPCVKHLPQALEQLHKTMEWCVNRQVLVDLSLGSYKPTVSQCRVKDFLSKLVASCSGKAPIVIMDGTASLNGEVEVVEFDVHVAEVAVANALSNASEHGDSSQPIELSSSLSEDSSGGNLLVFRVENYVLENGLTNDMLQTIRKDAVMRSEGVVHTAQKAPPKSANNHSTNSGLYHISLACKGVSGSFDLKLGNKKGGRPTVVLSIAVPAVLNGPATQRSTATVLALPPLASAAITPIPEGLKICSIDDAKIICKWFERLVLPKLKADATLSCVVCPASSSEVDLFVEDVMGRAKTDEMPPSPGRQADILVLDQHIIVKNEEGKATAILGTDLAQQFRNEGFKGLVTIRSANTSLSDVDGYMSSGAVDACIGKDQSHNDLVAEICAAYHENKSFPRTQEHAAGVRRTRKKNGVRSKSLSSNELMIEAAVNEANMHCEEIPDIPSSDD